MKRATLASLVVGLVLGTCIDPTVNLIKYGPDRDWTWWQHPAPTWLRAPHNYAVQEWAYNTVSAAIDKEGAPHGTYDWCLEKAEKQLVFDQNGKPDDFNKYGGTPIGLSDLHSEDLQNACAITLMGAEY